MDKLKTWNEEEPLRLRIISTITALLLSTIAVLVGLNSVELSAEQVALLGENIPEIVSAIVTLVSLLFLGVGELARKKVTPYHE